MDNIDIIDKKYMRIALEIARNGEGRVNPNPLVGAVIVKDDEIVAKGWHAYFGGPHAERHAMSKCTPEDLRGAIMYVTLEPCNHHGKTPPCTDAIIAAGIAEVVVGCKDQNPAVGGNGIAKLLEAGVHVRTGVLEEECLEINKIFFHYISKGTPYVNMKYAMTIDGRISTASGDSKWITGETARERVHRDRNRYAAIMVGVGTIIEDDPDLTCRIEGGRNPLRVICDTHLRTPLSSRIVRSANKVPTVIATCSTNACVISQYKALGCDVVCLPNRDGVDLVELMTILGKRGIDSVLQEGGAKLNWSALEAGIINGVQAYVAPKFFGSGAPPVTGRGVDSPSEALLLKNMRVTHLGKDVLIEADI